MWIVQTSPVPEGGSQTAPESLTLCGLGDDPGQSPGLSEKLLFAGQSVLKLTQPFQAYSLALLIQEDILVK